MSSDIAIKVEGLSKCYQIYDKPRDRLLQMLYRGHRQYYREFWALRDISFEIEKGETVGIIGRNGSGKSTLLQIICGILNPSLGKVETNGRIAALLELGSGFNMEFSGRENVYMNASVLGLTKDEIDSKFDAIVDFADIGNFIEQPVKTYSSGMMVRLAFGVQAQVDPDILIVDEALAVGDEKFQRKCFARLETLKKNGTSILFVSHAGPQIVELCDRGILLEQGARLMTAKPMQVVRGYQKLIYAPQDEQTKLIEEYLTLDKNSDLNSESDDPTIKDVLSDNDINTSDKDTHTNEDFYDHGLVPETTIVYPKLGAEIQKLQILDMKGREVNVLKPGNDYQIVISGRFLQKIEGCYFGTHIKSVSGVEVTGQRFPEEGKYIDNIGKNNNFKAIFNYKMSLLPGVYFVGGGVWSTDKDELICCHRIMDAVMFRVIQKPKTYSFGYIDAATKVGNVEFY